MRDEEYPPEQLPTYGLRHQPHLASLSHRLRTVVLIGFGMAVIAVVCCLAGVLAYPASIDNAGRLEARVALWMTLLMVLIVGYQAVAWHLAHREWSGRQDFNLRAIGIVSFVIHLVSYAVVLVGMWFGLTAVMVAGTASPAFWLIGVGVVALIVAQVVGATEYLRKSGPPGTVPAHMRRLVALNDKRIDRSA